MLTMPATTDEQLLLNFHSTCPVTERFGWVWCLAGIEETLRSEGVLRCHKCGGCRILTGPEYRFIATAWQQRYAIYLPLYRGDLWEITDIGLGFIWRPCVR